ncbi:MAG: glycosyltransferase family 2 protein [Desulfobacteria bacterium]
MTSTNPHVTIIIPTYNYARFLPDSIGSAVAQTFQETEILIMDNASTDETREVVRGFMAKDRRIRYVRNDTNIGAIQNFNKGIALAAGEYVKVLCADDRLEPACLGKTLPPLEKNPSVALSGCARRYIDSDGRPFGSILSFAMEPTILPGPDAIVRCLFHGNLIGEPSAVLFRKRDADSGFSIDYRQLVDLEFWFKLLERGSFAFTAEPLCYVREHAGQTTMRNLWTFSAARDEWKIYRDYGRKGYVALSRTKRAELVARRLSFCVLPPVMGALAKVLPIRR